MTRRPGSPEIEFVYFDCDSTLCAIEGIDELARMKGLYPAVAQLTQQAMEGRIRLEDIYGQRLSLLRPTKSDLQQLASLYCQKVVPDASETIAALQAAGVQVGMLSGGLLPALLPFAEFLGINSQRVHAVSISFLGDQYQQVVPSPLCQSNGKRVILSGLRSGETKTMLVGDGVTDLEAKDAVDCFVGFGGVARREQVEQGSEVYITSTRLAAVVPLALSPAQLEKLRGTVHETVWNNGEEDIRSKLVRFQV